MVTAICPPAHLYQMQSTLHVPQMAHLNSCYRVAVSYSYPLEPGFTVRPTLVGPRHQEVCLPPPSLEGMSLNFCFGYLNQVQLTQPYLF